MGWLRLGDSEGGLNNIIAASKSILRGSSFDEVRDLLIKTRDSVADTFLTIGNYSYKDILKKYMMMLDKAVSLLVRSYSVSKRVSHNEAQILVAGLTGLAASTSDCVFVKLLSGVEIRGKTRPQGSILCVEHRLAAYLVLAGLASLLSSGLGDVIGKAGSNI